jgi:uncharacterized protein with HEPN domain
MLPDKDRIRIQHMLDAAERIAAFTDGISKEQFLDDEKLNLAVIRLFEILGEAANNISEDLQEKYNDIPWREIAGIRNRLIHGYFDVDLNIVWQIIQQDIPPLISNLKYIQS